jgi:hypothetical protein
VPRTKNVPVRDSSAKEILFYASRSTALEMVGGGTAFILLSDPLEVALSSNSHRNQVDIEGLRPDQSLTMPPSVIRGAASGFLRPQKIAQSYLPNHFAKRDIPNKMKAPKGRS